MCKQYSYLTCQGILILCLLLVLALLMQGCFGNSSNRRGKLSDAMEESSDDHKGERKVDTEPDPDYEEEDDDDYIMGLSETSNAVVEDDSLTPFTTPVLTGPKLDWFTIAGGTGLVKNEDFYGFNHGNLAIGTFFAEKHYLELLPDSVGRQYKKPACLMNLLMAG